MESKERRTSHDTRLFIYDGRLSKSSFDSLIRGEIASLDVR